MAGISQSIVLIGIFFIVFGVGPRLSEKNRTGSAFLSALLARLNKNSPENVMCRVDSAPRRSTCQ